MESFNVVVTVSTTVCIDAENPAVAYTLDDCIRDIEENPLYVVGEWQKNAFGSYHNFYAVFSVSLAEN